MKVTKVYRTKVTELLMLFLAFGADAAENQVGVVDAETARVLRLFFHRFQIDFNILYLSAPGAVQVQVWLFADLENTFFLGDFDLFKQTAFGHDGNVLVNGCQRDVGIRFFYLLVKHIDIEVPECVKAFDNFEPLRRHFEMVTAQIRRNSFFIHTDIKAVKR